MQKIKSCLKQYKEITLALINLLQTEEYDLLDGLLDNRQNLIDEISQMSYTKATMNKIYKELQIQQLQDELNMVMNKKREEVKVNIEILIAKKNATKEYTNGFKVESLFFNKKI